MMTRKGFTLIELIMIIIVIGIIAVVAAPKIDVTTPAAGAFVDKLRADMRYAQNFAMARGRRTMINIWSTAYNVEYDTSSMCTCSIYGDVVNPDGSGPMHAWLNSGAYAGITISPSLYCLQFDTLGKPYSCATMPLNACVTATPSGMTIGVILNGITTVGTVTITAETGAVN